MKTRNHTVRPCIEALEDRKLLAIFLDVDGRLFVIGTDSAEQIKVRHADFYDQKTDAFVPGITASRADAAGSVIETQSFRLSMVKTLQLSGLGGSDVISNNTMLPSTIDAGAGVDIVEGGNGKDVIYGGSGSDFLRGRRGDDYLSGGGGADLLLGDAGNDQLRGKGGDDVLLGGRGDDDLSGSSGADWLLGGSDDDDLHGGSGKDFLFGDTPSSETMNTLAEFSDVPVPAGLSPDFTDDGGHAGNDVMSGSDDGDVLFGEAGIDKLHGGGGNDFMFGGQDSDLLAGGADTDFLDDESVLPEGLVKDSNADVYIYDLNDRVWQHAAFLTFGGSRVEDGPYEGYWRIVM